LFDESLKAIEQLMLEQLAQAKSSNTQVDKVLLVGGYADSPTLKRFLEMSLKRFNNQYGTNIILVVPPSNTSATGVATGALMRAQHKENGPKRVPSRSIGVLYHIPDDPAYDFAPEVLLQSWSTCELSGEEYIMRTLKWIIKAVSYPQH
jgi:molecular chaperone DnaK (HSP70)